MKELLTSLVWKCYVNDLRFEYIPSSNGISVSNLDYKSIAEVFDTTESTLKYIHKQVDLYLESEGSEEDEKYSNLTSYERDMKLAGHKQSDFL